ncbi:hypothetical protein C9J01_02255 [Photobacterium rosenbergii]|uniref:GtrA/DPMS transmembrane domain-containing protein n=1 Tax=Photobacterium rosenbergii TaxID=294936 RepID=A0A2T3NK11_9GAMM|nr:GtrA family protein [Photobacterium rosenbergii]PSW15856.1 hypothetical protein C9J01_02255 [Photobacterium rosenbergii]
MNVILDRLDNSLFRFLLVGGSSTGINLFLVNFCIYNNLMPLIQASIFGYIVGVIFSFFVQKTFTFRCGGYKSHYFFRFFVLSIFGVFFNAFIIFILVEHVQVNKHLSTFLSALIIAAINYFMLGKWVFK